MILNKQLLLLVGFLFTGLMGWAQNVAEDNSLKKNRLSEAISPYLRQHADNPVQWYEWGPEALQKAKTENKPLLISIGYAACHWCHVMEHESFMDTAVARLMNEHFVSIKIDREERPDIDQIYMNAVQLLTGSGGWPLNAFALPDGRPFYGGTYLPKEQWIKLLQQIANIYNEQHEKVVEQAESLTEGIRSQEMIEVPADAAKKLQKENYNALFDHWQEYIDYELGGYSHTPKFPMPAGWEFLLQYHYLTGEEKALKAVTTTLDALARGGIYDQIGGGFARYATDKHWIVPHFEKMLYDNGQLISLFSHAYQLTKNPEYKEVVQETLGFVEREMTSPEGGFYSSLNADSEGEEGKFYVWTKTEVEEILEEESAPLITDYYEITDAGNWEHGKNILYRKYAKNAFAQKHNLGKEEWKKLLDSAEEKLFNARNTRIRPTTDDKILTSWNALMLKGYVGAYLAFTNENYLQAALKNARFLEKNMIANDGHLWRNYKDGKVSIDAFLDDYALLADAYIQLYQATFDMHWLELARKLADYAITHFQDTQSGMFYYVSDRSEELVVRKMELADNVMPASNSVMAHVLYKLGEYFYHTPYLNMAGTMLTQMEQNIAEGGPYYANWARLMGLLTYQPYEVAIMGQQAKEKSRIMQQNYLPTALFMGGKEENLPLLENKLVSNETMIYVCQDKVCKLPVQEVQKALLQLK